MPKIFTSFTITASGFDRGKGGWSFNVAPKSTDAKRVIEGFDVDDEWNVTIEVEAPPDFSA